MPKDTLRVRARGDALVQDHDALLVGTRRYIGRRWDVAVPADGDSPNRYGFIPTDEDVVVPNTHDYKHELKHCCLWAADEETAKKAGVKFDPNFGADPKATVSTYAQATVSRSTEEH